MNRSAQFCAVITCPMKNQVAINKTISGIQFHGDAARQGCSLIGEKMVLFFICIWADMASGYYPQHIVVVKRDIPLNATDPTLAHSGLQSS